MSALSVLLTQTCQASRDIEREQAAPCELCGATPAPYRYACLPHVRWEHLCENCAGETMLAIMLDGDGPITQTPDWYLCGPGEEVPRG